MIAIDVDKLPVKARKRIDDIAEIMRKSESEFNYKIESIDHNNGMMRFKREDANANLYLSTFTLTREGKSPVHGRYQVHNKNLTKDEVLFYLRYPRKDLNIS